MADFSSENRRPANLAAIGFPVAVYRFLLVALERMQQLLAHVVELESILSKPTSKNHFASGKSSTNELMVVCPIKVINRFREVTFRSDAQFGLNLSVKNRVVAALTALDCRSIIEVGCGQFPITGLARDSAIHRH